MVGIRIRSNGKLERFHLEIEQHLKSFEEESASNTVRNVGPRDHVGSPFHAAGVTDPMARLVDWYNDLPHMSLMDGRETPAEAYVRKQAVPCRTCHLWTAGRLPRKHTYASRHCLVPKVVHPTTKNMVAKLRL